MSDSKRATQAASPEAADLFADSLIKLGQANDVLPTLERDLASVIDVFEKHPRIRRFLSDPVVKDEGKRMALVELVGQRIHPILRHFISLLVDLRLTAELPTIADVFARKASWLRQQETGELVTAWPLSPGAVAEIEKETGRLLGKDVHLRVREDPNLLGGVRVKVGDFVIDGTVDRQLENLRAELLV